MWRPLPSLILLFLLLQVGCATAPGDTASTARERTVADQILAFDSSKEAGGDPDCVSRKVVNTEVTRPFEPGSREPAGQWTERWTVDRCGRLMPYLVDFLRAPDGHLGINIQREAGMDRAIIPGSTLGDRLLQRDTFLLLVQKDVSELEGGPCRTRKVMDTEVVLPLGGAQVEAGRPVAGEWAERWTLDRCGVPVRYIVRFSTTRTGTTFTAELEK